MTVKVISVLVGAAVVLTACSGHQAHPGASPTTASQPSASQPAASQPSVSSPAVLPTRVIAKHPSLGAGLPLLAGFGDVWSASGSGLVRFTLEGQGQAFLGKPVRDIALSPHAVVVLLDRAPQLLTVDPRSLRVLRRWRLADPGVSVTTDRNVAYIVEGAAPARVSRLDLTSGAMTTRVLPFSFTPVTDRSIAVGDGSVWFATPSHVYRLDPRTLVTLRSTTNPIPASSLWFGDGAIWVSSDSPGGGVFRLDPRTARITTTARTDAIQMAFAPQRVWLAAAAGATAVQPSTGALVGIIPPQDVPDDSSAGIALVGSRLWVAYANQGIVQILHVSPH